MAREPAIFKIVSNARSVKAAGMPNEAYDATLARSNMCARSVPSDMTKRSVPLWYAKCPILSATPSYSICLYCADASDARSITQW